MGETVIVNGQEIPVIKCRTEEVKSINEDGTERVDVFVYAPLIIAKGKKSKDNVEKEK